MPHHQKTPSPRQRFVRILLFLLLVSSLSSPNSVEARREPHLSPQNVEGVVLERSIFWKKKLLPWQKNSAPPPPTPKHTLASQLSPVVNHLSQKGWFDVTCEACKVVYGSILIVYGRHLEGQILAMTVMRAFGYAKLERAVVEWRKNVRQAIRSALYNSPSLIMARRAIKDLANRKEMARKIIEEAEKARKDGTVTKRESRRILKLHRRQVSCINRDLKRLKRGTGALSRVYRTLDVQEIREIFNRFAFLGTAVLASGNSWIGHVLSLYCHFWSLGSLLMETNKKLGLPLSTYILDNVMQPPLEEHEIQGIMRNPGKEDDNLKQLRILMGSTIMYVLAAAFILWKNNTAGVRLNAAFLSASIVMRGISALLAPPSEDDENDEVDENSPLQGLWGGLSTIALAGVSLYCGNMVDHGKLNLPKWLKPLSQWEHIIDKLVSLADKL